MLFGLEGAAPPVPSSHARGKGRLVLRRKMAVGLAGMLTAGIMSAATPAPAQVVASAPRDVVAVDRSPSSSQAAPKRIGRFISSSHRTVLLYYRWAITAGSGFSGSLAGPPGYEIATVIQTGYILKTLDAPAPVTRVSVTTRLDFYHSDTGRFDVSVNVHEPFEDGFVTFVAVFSDPGVATFTAMNSPSCTGPGTCGITATAAGAVPPGMQYVGVGVHEWQVGTAVGLTPVKDIGAHVDHVSVGATDVEADLTGVLTDGSSSPKSMVFEWQASVLAFKPSEMTRVVTTPPYEYPIDGRATKRRAIKVTDANPAGRVVKGFLDGLEGFRHHFTGVGSAHDIWMLEASSTLPVVGPVAVSRTYRVMLGTIFGETSTTDPYIYEFSRTPAFLH
jgi:hypothetical protein